MNDALIEHFRNTPRYSMWYHRSINELLTHIKNCFKYRVEDLKLSHIHKVRGYEWYLRISFPLRSLEIVTPHYTVSKTVTDFDLDFFWYIAEQFKLYDAKLPPYE